MYPRGLEFRLREALADTPAVLVVGARQSGKSTLVQHIAQVDVQYTLDDLTLLAAAQADPKAFIAPLGSALIDEIQRAPELLLPIKASIDQNRKPGRFLLTGSANVLTLPAVSESLAGRMEVLTLYPLAQAEIENRISDRIEGLFQQSHPLQFIPDATLMERILRGGYPEVVERSTGRRKAWFSSYITTILQRDVRDLANISGLTQLPDLLKLCAVQTANLLNHADLARTLQLPVTTFRRYLTLLEQTYLVQLLPAWSSNLNKRYAKAPKLHLVDPGLAAHLMGVNASRLQEDRKMLGPLLESFVVTEILKHLSWSNHAVIAHHYRTHDGQEIDLVLERDDGKLVGIEVKAAQTLESRDFRQLKQFSEDQPERFVAGYVIYTGNHTVPFGPHLYGLPVQSLWQ